MLIHEGMGQLLEAILGRRQLSPVREVELTSAAKLVTQQLYFYFNHEPDIFLNGRLSVFVATTGRIGVFSVAKSHDRFAKLRRSADNARRLQFGGGSFCDEDEQAVSTVHAYLINTGQSPERSLQLNPAN